MVKKKSHIAAAFDAIPEKVWSALIFAVMTSIIAFLQVRASVQVAKAAVEVENVRTTLEDTTATSAAELAEVKQIATDTHTLVNSASLVNLRLYAVAARRIATLTNDPADITAAEAAEKQAKEHQEKQDTVDRETSHGGPNPTR